MSRMTWKKPNGEWGVRGVALSTLPPVLYAMAKKLLDFEERCESPDALDALIYRIDDLQAECSKLKAQLAAVPAKRDAAYGHICDQCEILPCLTDGCSWRRGPQRAGEGGE